MAARQGTDSEGSDFAAVLSSGTMNSGLNQDAGVQAGDVVGEAKQKAGEAIGQAQEKASQVAGQVADQTQEKVKSGLTAGKEQAAEQLGTVAQALQKTGEQLQGPNSGAVGEYAATAADKLNQLADHLRQSNVDQLLNEVEDLARREPALVLGGAFVLGLLGARFLKSSAQQRRYSGGYSGSGYSGSGYSGSGYSGSYSGSGYGGSEVGSSHGGSGLGSGSASMPGTAFNAPGAGFDAPATIEEA